MGLRHAVLFVAALAGCTQNFDLFVAKDGADDDVTTQGDAANDVAEAGPPCDAAASCLSSANLCGQSCISGYNSCVGSCGGSGACKSLCKSQEQTCEMTCVTICDDCVDAGCAQSACTAALP